MGRYSLNIHDYQNNTDRIMKIIEDGISKDKVDLTNIDLQFLGVSNSSEEYIKKLQKVGYKISDNSAVFITYKENGKTKKLPIIYGNHPFMTYMSLSFNNLKDKYQRMNVKNSETREEVLREIQNDKIWNDFYKLFITAITNGRFIRFFKDSPYTNAYVYEYVGAYNAYKRMSSSEEIVAFEDAEFNIKRMLLSYKNIRDIYMAMMSFNKKFDYNFSLNNDEINAKLDKMDPDRQEIRAGSFDNPELNPLDVWTLEELQEIMNAKDYRQLVSDMDEQKTR